jgi:hypothetical protein
MALPIKIVTMDGLMKRWNMSFNDIFLIVLNHDLMPVYKKYPSPDWQKYGQDPDHNFFGVFIEEDADPSEIVFLRSDVEKLEQKFGGQIAKSAKVIDEAGLMERWGMSKIELWEMQISCSLSVADPLGKIIQDFDWVIDRFPIERTSHGDLIVYFKLSDIEKIEKEYGIEPKTSPIIVTKEKKLRPVQLHRIKCREVAEKLWGKHPNMTIADMIEQKEILSVSKKTNGKYYLEKTIRNWINDLCPDRSPGRRRKKV